MKMKILVIFVILILAGVAWVLVELLPTQRDTHEVAEIIDGDTIRLTNGERVRLIGINAPETGQPYADSATQKLTQLIEGHNVSLERDEEDRDQYGRLLRYIYIGDTFVNLKIVREGYAIAYPFSPNLKYSDDFEEAEQQARNAERGLWSPSIYELSVSDIHADAEGDDSENLNDEYVVFRNEGNSSLDISGWTIQDTSNNFYTFPDCVLAVGSSAYLYTGSGTDSEPDFYWGSTKPIWNNGGDRLFLRDSEGYLVTYIAY